MKIIKRFFAVLVALTFMLGLFSTNYNVHADTQKLDNLSQEEISNL